ncbi:serine/threonine protein phosphatase 1 [Pseudochelatococcus lubricantis]|uniref:Serine/threonine protein phosphatase 1 n=1 Tax=Pseudochelatococcus lubricantis TaxID=1538102 RepID=A0ABX0V325_9HYPH|nr:metallophosphoesterase [Pseudochelatococcus lubricantis]NIJ57441.1 serine/threonine protein phosphatase 1 [Pseudochelatococcus lubricantis]
MHMLSRPSVLRFDWRPTIRTLPEGQFVAAIGDVHGHDHLLAAMHDAIRRELDELGPRSAAVIHLGDLIDRGPRNREALVRARAGIDGASAITLRGNHEDRLLAYLGGSPAALGPWLDAGGEGMFTQMGLDPWRISPGEFRARFGEDLARWLEATPVMHRIGQLVFVHAGIDPALPLDRQDPHTLMWTRRAWIDSPGPYPEGVAVIHGHIPRRTVDFRDRHRIDLDSGVVNWGILSGLVFHGDRMRLLQVS